MPASRFEIVIDTRGHGDVVDVTTDAAKAIANAGFDDGICTVFVAHTTCGVAMIEAEPGCNTDLNRVLDELCPEDAPWKHNELNSDTNGHSHTKAAFIGPSVTIPFADAEMLLGTWQRIVCIDFDDRPRTRRVVVQVLGG